MTRRPASTIIALVVLIVSVLSASVILSLEGANKASTATAVFSTLLATLAPTITTIFLVGQVQSVKKDTDETRQGVEHVLNGTMDAKIVNAVEATLKAHGIVSPNAAPVLETALATIEKTVEEVGSNALQK